MKKSTLAVAMLLGLAASAAAAAQPRPDVAYPDGYRRWVHIKSGWIGEGSPAFPHFGGDGWRFTEFQGDSHTERTLTSQAAVKACAGCHAASKIDSVFSNLGDAAS